MTSPHITSTPILSIDELVVYVPLETSPPGGENVTNSDKPSVGVIALATVNTFLALCCIILSVVMGYFLRKTRRGKGTLIQTLYFQNGLTDFFVGLGVLFHCPILFLLVWKGRGIFEVTIPVFISYSVTCIAVKISVFMNCVIGVVRCINIVKPFYVVNKRVLFLCTLIYLVIWSSIVGVDLWQYSQTVELSNKVFMIKSLILKGLPGFGYFLLTIKEKEYHPSYYMHQVFNFVQFIIPSTVPTLVCLLAMSVQIHRIKKKTANRQPSSREIVKTASNTSIKKVQNAGVTILLLTVIYVATSAVSIVTWLIVDGKAGYLGSKSTYDELVEEKRKPSSWSDLTAIYFSLSTCPLICSTLTPLTLLLRGTGPAFSSARGFFSKFRSSGKSKNETQT